MSERILIFHHQPCCLEFRGKFCVCFGELLRGIVGNLNLDNVINESTRLSYATDSIIRSHITLA